MSDFFDIKDRDFQENPHPVYKRLIAECPVHHSERYGFYSVSRYQDVKEILRETAMWSSKFGPGTAYADPNAPNALVNVDPPEHDFQLKLVNKAFTRQSINALEPDIAAYVKQLVDGLKPKGRADLMRDFAMHIPLFVISKMLGVNPDDGLMFRGWVEELTMGVFGDADPAVIQRVQADFGGYFMNEVQKRHQLIEAGGRLGDDLITRLLTAEVDGKKLEPARVLGFISFLLVAGSGTTTMLVCNTIHHLLENPDQMAKVLANPELIPAAAEESMRFTAPVHGLFRTNNEDVTLHGVTIPKDSKVMCMFAAANLDESQFSEPDRFNVERDQNELRKQLGFGWGTHICTGAPLARMEARIALTEVLSRLPNLRADGPATQTAPSVLYGFDHLPVAWDVE
jgi:cytochrome P450